MRFYKYSILDMFAENKEDKKGERWATALFLEKRLGKLASTTSKDTTNSSNSSASNDGPLCAGIYNSSAGLKVHQIYLSD